jgi:hypothetical protein
MRGILLAVALLAFAGPVWAQASKDGEGPLSLDRLGRVEIRAARFDTDDPADEKSLILIDGRSAFRAEIGDSHKIIDAFPSHADPRIVLIDGDGWLWCRHLFLVVDLRGPEPRFLENPGRCHAANYLWTGTQILFRSWEGNGVAYTQDGRVIHAPVSRAHDNLREGIAAYQAGRYDLAARLLWPLEERQWPQAPYLVGLMAETGRGLPRDLARAEAAYARAAEHFHPGALYRLGRLKARAGDHRIATGYFAEAARYGSSLAMLAIGEAYREGKGVDALPEEAAFWLGVAEVHGRIAPGLAKARAALSEAGRVDVDRRVAEWRPLRAAMFEQPGDLEAWNGKHPFERIAGRTIFEVEALTRRLRAAFGAEATRALAQMFVAPPAGIDDDGYLAVRGCPPHVCHAYGFDLLIRLDGPQVAGCVVFFGPGGVWKSVEAATGVGRVVRSGKGREHGTRCAASGHTVAAYREAVAHAGVR